ncbi:transforming growth factor beta receptor type 3 [Trichonephila clavata]|uniref:Transforming growth factor beta receptor type 3 n=1 Tax=Trichonephila clavata TaxID=2740835 RepID=A0A8X6LY85_TRICU|nr:transforming growth factor beta receptor type 3 [Trichonephila clavata]
MCLSVQDNAEKLHEINCKVDELFSSAYVTPVVDQPTEVTGCHSCDTASGDQEIHVLSLLRASIHSFEARNEYVPSVSLDVRPRWKEKHPTSTVVILLSATPVMWQMNLHHMGNSTSFHVIVNKTSHVVPSIPVPVLRRKLPPMKRLPTWIKSHHGAVTSFSFIPVANEITLFVGIDTSDSAQGCNFSSQAQSVHVKASFVQLQPATGCSVKIPNDIRKKHNILYVIELNSNALNSDVLVHLKHPNSDFMLKNAAELNVTLVLKCHVPVEWIVQSSGIQGLLRIVAEHPVHVQTNPLILTTIVQEKSLSFVTSTLLASVHNTFGPIDTYMKSSKANRINIVVREKTKYIIEDVSNEDNPAQEKEEKSLAGSEVNFVLGKDKPIPENTSTKMFTEQSLNQLLMKQMTLKCSSDKISVTFPLQETMNIFSVAIESDRKLIFITLSDVNCKAKQNESHIILQTNWHGCGTRRVVNGGIQYYNQVQFITAKYGGDKDSVGEQKHLPTDDDDYISEDGSGSDDLSSTHLKCCGEERFVYPLPFHCTRSVNSETLNTSSENYELNLFTKKDFLQPLPPKKFPLNIVVHDHLFAEASIKADFRLCIVIDECWLSEEAKPTLALGRKSILIKQGCPTDLSVDILSKSHCGNLNPDVDHYKMRFSFQLSEEFINQQLYLHCRLASCAMRDSKQLNAKQCIISENFCLKQSLRPYLDSLRGKKFSLLVQGPIHVISKSRLGKEKDIQSLSSPESSSTPDSFAVDYSFDKLTGNAKKNPISQELVFVGLSTEAVVGIAFASFIIGAGLMATLWLIHMHTEPSRNSKESRKQSNNQFQSNNQSNFENAECADRSVPVSLKPMSVQQRHLKYSNIGKGRERVGMLFITSDSPHLTN